MRPVVLLSDFGLDDPYVGLMKAVIVSIAPAAPLVDLTHSIPPQDVRVGALVLRHALPHMPPGAIVVAVVDPGVGGPRRPLVMEAQGVLLVGPDNGLLTGAVPPSSRRRTIAVTESRYFRQPVSRTFHGRDVFAPVAAHLAQGLDPAALGAEAEGLVEANLPLVRTDADGIRGEIVYVDRFGNLVTNVPAEALDTDAQEIAVEAPSCAPAPLLATYAAAAEGELLAVVNSWGLVEIAVRNASAAARLGLTVGTPIRVRVRRR